MRVLLIALLAAISYAQTVWKMGMAGCWNQAMNHTQQLDTPWANMASHDVNSLLLLGDNTYPDTLNYPHLPALNTLGFGPGGDLSLGEMHPKDNFRKCEGQVQEIEGAFWVHTICLSNEDFLATMTQNIADSYTRLMQTEYRTIRESGADIYAMYDDHDVGGDNWDSRFIYKETFSNLFIDTFPKDTPFARAGSEGLYESFILTPDGLTIHLIKLDDHYFLDKDANIFYGEDQWTWLETEMRRDDITPDVRIISQGSGFVWEDMEGRGFFSQNLFDIPSEQERFLDLVEGTKGDELLLLVNGDWHWGVFKEGYIRPGVFAYEIAVGAMYSYKWDAGYFSANARSSEDSTQYKSIDFNYGMLSWDNTHNLLTFDFYDSQASEPTVVFSKELKEPETIITTPEPEIVYKSGSGYIHSSAEAANNECTTYGMELCSVGQLFNAVYNQGFEDLCFSGWISDEFENVNAGWFTAEAGSCGNTVGWNGWSPATPGAHCCSSALESITPSTCAGFMCGSGFQLVGSPSDVYCTSAEGCNAETCCEEFSEAQLYMVVPGADSNRDYIYSSGQEADEACAAAHPDLQLCTWDQIWALSETYDMCYSGWYVSARDANNANSEFNRGWVVSETRAEEGYCGGISGERSWKKQDGTGPAHCCVRSYENSGYRVINSYDSNNEYTKEGALAFCQSLGYTFELCTDLQLLQITKLDNPNVCSSGYVADGTIGWYQGISVNGGCGSTNSWNNWQSSVPSAHCCLSYVPEYIVEIPEYGILPASGQYGQSPYTSGDMAAEACVAAGYDQLCSMGQQAYVEENHSIYGNILCKAGWVTEGDGYTSGYWSACGAADTWNGVWVPTNPVAHCCKSDVPELPMTVQPYKNGGWDYSYTSMAAAAAMCTGDYSLCSKEQLKAVATTEVENNGVTQTEPSICRFGWTSDNELGWWQGVDDTCGSAGWRTFAATAGTYHCCTNFDGVPLGTEAPAALPVFQSVGSYEYANAIEAEEACQAVSSEYSLCSDSEIIQVATSAVVAPNDEWTSVEMQLGLCYSAWTDPARSVELVGWYVNYDGGEGSCGTEGWREWQPLRNGVPYAGAYCCYSEAFTPVTTTQPVCGDDICADNEMMTCPEDCPTEVIEAVCGCVADAGNICGETCAAVLNLGPECSLYGANGICGGIIDASDTYYDICPNVCFVTCQHPYEDEFRVGEEANAHGYCSGVCQDNGEFDWDCQCDCENGSPKTGSDCVIGSASRMQCDSCNDGYELDGNDCIVHTFEYPSDNDAWAEFGETCASGMMQSPIDLPGHSRLIPQPALDPAFNPISVRVEDTGYSLKWTLGEVCETVRYPDCQASETTSNFELTNSDEFTVSTLPAGAMELEVGIEGDTSDLRLNLYDENGDLFFGSSGTVSESSTNDQGVTYRNTGTEVSISMAHTSMVLRVAIQSVGEGGMGLFKLGFSGVAPCGEVQECIDSGKTVIGGTEYDAIEFQVHAASEHTIMGQQADIEFQFIHQNDEGGYAVIAFMCNAGESDLEFWNELEGSLLASTSLNAESLFSSVDMSQYFTYEGSMTTPPCTEDVEWIVMVDYCTIPTALLNTLTDYTSMQNNYRAVQPLNGRVVGNAIPDCTCPSWASEADDGDEMCAFQNGQNCALASGFPNGCPRSAIHCVLVLGPETTVPVDPDTCILVSHGHDNPGFITCDCVDPADPCLTNGDCIEEPACPEADGNGITTDPCDCDVDSGYGFSSDMGMCVFGGVTDCGECGTMEGCITNTCAEAGCPEYDSMRTCQCDPSCAEFDNCCEDALTQVCLGPCDCPSGYGWSSDDESCAMGHTTNCLECPSQDRCDASTCVQADCPMSYDANRVCQCNFECNEYDNCCEDANVCYADDTLPSNVIPPVNDCVNPGWAPEGFPNVMACVSPTTQMVYINGVDTCITAESVGLDSYSADSSFTELNAALNELFLTNWYLSRIDLPECTNDKTFGEAVDDQLWITNEMVGNLEGDVEECEQGMASTNDYSRDWISRVTDLVNDKLPNFDSETQNSLTEYLASLQDDDGDRRY